MGKEQMLGDGIYAIYDGYAICLRVPNSEDDDVVVLEPEVLAELVMFAKAVGVLR